MERYVSISLSNPYIAEDIYRRIVGEARARGLDVRVTVEGSTIILPRVEGIEEVLWRVVKSTPAAVFSVIDFK